MPSNPESNGNISARPLPQPDHGFRIPALSHPVLHPELRLAVMHLATCFVASPAFDRLVADVDERAATDAAHLLLAALFPAAPAE